jgi:phytanoyl-CoA hydroxylase
MPHGKRLNLKNNTMIRRLKLLYATYNFFQPAKLRHNEEAYRKLGLKKRYFSPVSSKDFEGKNANLLRQDTPPVQVAHETAFYKDASSEVRAAIDAYDEQGFIVLPGYLSVQQVDEVNSEIDRLLNEKKIKFNAWNKLMFVIKQSALIRGIGTDARLLELLDSLMGGRVKLFQSINFIKGSEQKTHSDSIHMTTFPLGGLLGVWIALEDIDAANGGLHYYPGSHKLPYYLNSDYQNEGSALLLGDKGYSKYEEMLEAHIVQSGMEKKVFTAKKGDMLIWHANLLHGGEPHTDTSRTRKSVVFHYYMKNCVCYHEITQRPALMESYN